VTFLLTRLLLLWTLPLFLNVGSVRTHPRPTVGFVLWMMILVCTCENHVSHSTKDFDFANYVHDILVEHNLNVFLAPIIWEIRTEALPGWIKNYQAIDISNQSTSEIRLEFEQIAERIKSKKRLCFMNIIQFQILFLHSAWRKAHRA